MDTLHLPRCDRTPPSGLHFDQNVCRLTGPHIVHLNRNIAWFDKGAIAGAELRHPYVGSEEGHERTIWWIVWHPTRPLVSVNSTMRMHGAKAGAVLGDYRDQAYWATNQLRILFSVPRPIKALVHTTIWFPVERRRDPHNYTGTVVKGAVDGMTVAGLWPDDYAEWVATTEPRLRSLPESGTMHGVVTHRIEQKEVIDALGEAR